MDCPALWLRVAYYSQHFDLISNLVLLQQGPSTQKSVLIQAYQSVPFLMMAIPMMTLIFLIRPFQSPQHQLQPPYPKCLA